MTELYDSNFNMRKDFYEQSKQSALINESWEDKVLKSFDALTKSEEQRKIMEDYYINNIYKH